MTGMHFFSWQGRSGPSVKVAAGLATVLSVAVMMSCEEAGISGTEGGASWAVLQVDSIVQVGGASARGPAAIGRVMDVALLGEPTEIAVADWDAQEIRVFSLEGEYERTLGRSGEGPGEFTGLMRMSSLPTGDLVAWDLALYRLTLFFEDGDEVVSVDFSSFPNRQPVFLGVRSDTTFVFRMDLHTSELQGRPSGEVTDTVPFVTVDQRGQVRDTLVTSVAPREHFFDFGAIWGLEGNIFGRKLQALLVGDQLLVGSNEVVSLEAYPREGTGNTIHLDLMGAEATTGMVEAERQRRMEGASLPLSVIVDGVDIAEQLEAKHRAVIAGLHAEPHVPAFDGLVVGAVGSFWIKRYAMAEDSVAAWILIGPDGEPKGTAMVPMADRLVGGGRENYVTLGRDDLDATILTIHFLSQE